MDTDTAGKTPAWLKAVVAGKFRQASAWLWGRGDTAPRGTVEMICAALDKLDGEDPKLTDEELKLVNLIFLNDEPNRLNRSGSAITGLGGSVAGATGIPLVVTQTAFDADTGLGSCILLFAVSLGFACLAVGQGLKLFLIQRESVGPSVVAIVEHRKKALAAAEGEDGAPRNT